MGTKIKTASDPAVINVYGGLMAEVASLKERFGLSNLTIVVRDGKYFLNVDGQLIEITFVNGKIIPADVFENLSARLAALLEQNGFEPLTLNELPTATISQEELEQGLALFSFASIGMLAHSQNDRSDRTFVLESINKNDQNDTIVLDYNQRLNQNIKPTPDDFEILINNVPTLVSDIRITDDKVILEFDQDILSGDDVLLTYKDQNGDTRDSIQSANGELASAFIQGVAIDGYIAGAQMFIDKDSDGIPDPDELLEGITTNGNGMFILDAALNPENYPLLIVGGTNKDTGLANNTVLTAHAGSTVITPTTTLIQTMVRNGLVANVDEAETTLKNALGIDTVGPNTVDLLNFDPISAIKNDPQNAAAVALHKANTSIVQIIESVGTGSSANAIAATAKVAELMVEQSASTDPADWSALSSEVVDSVLVSGNNGALKAELGLIVEAIQQADGENILEAIASAQKGVVVTVKTPDVTNDQTPVISGSATPGSTVTIVIRNQLLPEDPGATYEVKAAADGSWSIDTGTLDPIAGTLSLSDSNTVSATATKLGITSTPVTFELEIDTTAPLANLAVFDDFGGVQGELSDGDTTDDSQLVLTGKNEVGSTVEVFNGTTSLGNATILGEQWRYVAAIEDGTTYEFNAIETDTAGNTSDPTASITITGDSTAPSAPVPALATDTNLNDDGITSDATVNVTGIETDAIWGYSVDGGSNWTAGTGTSFELAEGHYSDGALLVSQFDLAGNLSTEAALSGAITVDTTAPSAFAIDATLEVDNIVNAAEDETVSVTGTSTGVEQGQTVSVRLSDVSNNVDVTATVGADGTWTAADADISALTNGSITITADVSDAAGNAATQVTKTITLDNVAPTAALTAATDDVGSSTGTLTSGDTTDDIALVLSGTNESGSTVEVFDGTTSLSAATVTGTTWSYTATVADGTTYAFNAKETDAAGNTSTATTDFDVIGDTTAPSQPTSSLSSSNTLTVTGTAEDDAYLILDDSGTAAGSTKYDIIDNIGSDGTLALQNLLALDTHQFARGTIASGGTTGTISTAGLMDGDYELYLVDKAGNFSSAAASPVTVSGSNVIDNTTSTYEYDIEFVSIDDGTNSEYTDTSSTAGVANNDKSTVDVEIVLNDVATGDELELYIDGKLFYSPGNLTDDDKTNGTVTMTNVTLDDYDDATGTEATSTINPADDIVTLEVKVKHQGVYVQDDADVTWDYQY